ncbi:YutD-like domain-containing protein [Paenibacillus sp. R14(2021)]|uniref:YutD-like domain-containing protein n=1 Tax=Paenibacillus sp. R14(2021) TaxID=2859228 RepID=UPI001C613BEA|nr:YutD family protein [Paenibacillus sp. R14(2021)]
MIHISGRAYALIHENRNGWNLEAFRERFSEVLERYDYVIGDWGYNQLRLKGFFRDNHPKATRESAISSMVDYINEYCNFGCAYFVLEKQPGGSKQGDDGEITEDGELDGIELPDGAEEAYMTASQAIAAAKAHDAPASENQHVKFMPRHERDLRREQQRNSRKETSKDVEKEKDGPRESRKPFNKEREHGPRQGQQSGRNQQQAHDRSDRSERQERPERGDRNQERGERPDRSDRSERSERPERGERNDQHRQEPQRNEPRGERRERNDRGGERNDRGERQERSDRPERSRNKRNHFNNNKAPVAAASEQQHNRGKEPGPKQP